MLLLLVGIKHRATGKTKKNTDVLCSRNDDVQTISHVANYTTTTECAYATGIIYIYIYILYFNGNINCLFSNFIVVESFFSWYGSSAHGKTFKAWAYKASNYNSKLPFNIWKHTIIPKLLHLLYIYIYNIVTYLCW